MALRVERYPDTAEARAAAARFNERMCAAGVTEFQLGQDPFSCYYPEHRDSPVWQQYYLALDEAQDGSTSTLEARGGYVLQCQHYRSAEGVAPAGFLRFPISEGIVNRAYVVVGVQLLRDAMMREPRLFALGMGGITRPLPRIMATLGWLLHEVPFHFLVLHPFRFFREARTLRRTRALTFGCDLLAWSGLGWAGTRLLQIRSHATGLSPAQKVTLEPDFGPWADTILEASAPHYRLLGERSSRLLNKLYPAADPRWIRLVLWQGDAPAGWALLLCTDCKGHKQFGNLRLGSIADCLAPPEHAQTIVAAAVAELKRRGADLVVSNQTHHAWNTALEHTGFIKGPSNFVFGVSPRQARTLFPDGQKFDEVHINRGDGDGPINL